MIGNNINSMGKGGFWATTILSSPIPIPNRNQINTSFAGNSTLLSLRCTSRAPPSSAAAAVTADAVTEAERQTIGATLFKSLPFRVGHGFDFHRVEPGYPLIIGGIHIPFGKGCEAHSDGKNYSYINLVTCISTDCGNHSHPSTGGAN